MSGFERNIFIDLPQSLEKHLICSICRNIYNNGVKSGCEHTFCKSCVQEWIELNNKSCPKCDIGFTTRKRTKRTRSDCNLVIVSNFVFKYNLTANNIINELKVKCDFESNGCQEEIELGLLSTHLLECEHRVCKTCGFTVEGDVDHNCLELLKTDRNQLKASLIEIGDSLPVMKENINNIFNAFKQNLNEMKAKNERLKQEMINKSNEFNAENSLLEKEIKVIRGSEVRANNKLRDIESKLKSSEIKNTRLESELNEIKSKKNLVFNSETISREDLIHISLNEYFDYFIVKVESIYFGTHLTHSYKIGLNSSGIYFITAFSKDYKNFCIIYKFIEEIKYCFDPSFPVLILRPFSQCCAKIGKHIQSNETSHVLVNYGTDDLNERNIIIKFSPQYLPIQLLARIALILRSYHSKTQNKFKSIDAKEAKLMVNNVLNFENLLFKTKNI